jgi:hypothetical protein
LSKPLQLKKGRSFWGVKSRSIIGFVLSSITRGRANAYLTWMPLGSVNEFPEGETRLATFRNPNVMPTDGKTVDTACWVHRAKRDQFATAWYILSEHRHFAVSVLEDQQCAGALMWTCITIIYLVPAASLTVRLLGAGNAHAIDLRQSKSILVRAHSSNPQSVEAR